MISQHAVIVAHGQPKDPHGAEKRLAALADIVQDRLPDWIISSATMALPGKLEGVLEHLPDNTLIYPLFMTNGWFVQRALAHRLKPYPRRILRPLGLDPALSDLAAADIRKAAIQAGWRPEELEILIAMHGSVRSESDDSSGATFMENLKHHVECKSIAVGFLEKPPFLTDIARQMPASTLCLPFFSRDGFHVFNDIPAALAEASFRGTLLPSIGLHESVPALIAQTIVRCSPTIELEHSSCA